MKISISIPGVAEPSSLLVNADSTADLSSIQKSLFELFFLQSNEYFLTQNGHKLADDSVVSEASTVYVQFRQVGGKGGFGSLLRSFGGQIEKSTNKNACRDLSGRRIRDVENEKVMKEWLAKEAEREKDKLKKKEEKLKKKLEEPKHVFVDYEYDRQKQIIANNLDDAMEEAKKIMKAKGKRKHEEEEEAGSSKSKKKPTELWLGVDVADVGSSDDDSSSGEEESHKCSSSGSKDTSQQDEPGTSSSAATA